MALRAHSPALLAPCLLFAAASVAAVVENPAQAPQPSRTVTLKEVWRAGGEDDEIFFGNVGRVLSGPDGTVLVLDNQQSQVQVYDAGGTWLRTLGHEGEGPGEVRQPADAFPLPDGRLCLAQSFPGRLVFLDRDGLPAGQGQYQPKGAAATFCVMVSGRPAPGGMLLAGIRFNQSGGPLARQTFFLSLCDEGGAEQVVYLEKQYEVNYADFRLDEASMDFVWLSRMDVDRQGRVYTAPERDRYLVRVQSADGKVEREFTRAVSIPDRTAEERDIAVKIHRAIGANYGGIPLQGVTVEDRQAAVSSLVARPDGTVWVSSPANPVPPGAIAVYDVYDAAGRYTHQVVLNAPGDPDRDSLYILDDGRIALVCGGLDAWLSQQGVESTSDDAPVLEIVCYEGI
ncbi:MAG TPA: hypothetical protein PLL30_11025 [Candidatus Krumholzibacteria bacterium]|nr:hypothetical protein [Candidatus Krumholzibacteria bacterium]HPD72297.1 hypothetical protein [Candidatus Krumholzibacteria bacterium]HRY40771.1 hypothetical protein [Candidatus Krumholzibacteria bacterium]